MGPSVELQLIEAAAGFSVGIAAGLLYDLFRVLRKRARLTFLTHFLDAVFFFSVAAALLSLSFAVGFGQQRITDTVIAVLGGGVYFYFFSPIILKFLTGLISVIEKAAGLLLLPWRKMFGLCKKLKKNIKSIFHYNAKWYRITFKYKIAVVSDKRKQNGGGIDEKKKTQKYPGDNSAFGTCNLCNGDSGIYVRKNRHRFGRKRKP